MRRHGIDYFENSRRATYACAARLRHPQPQTVLSATARTAGAITAVATVPDRRKGVSTGCRRRFYDYLARGIPDGPDDGTLVALGGCHVAALRARDRASGAAPSPRHRPARRTAPMASPSSFNPTFGVGRGHRAGWIAPETIAINPGTDGADDREPSLRLPVEADAALQADRRPSPRRFQRRLAGPVPGSESWRAVVVDRTRRLRAVLRSVSMFGVHARSRRRRLALARRLVTAASTRPPGR